ncbi:MAG: hypothetical protein JWN20_432 [Jatrophihabitantaceae bacterium]|nr:hypothetical protein [Jatrophihabitantaceae bacterium]
MPRGAYRRPPGAAPQAHTGGQPPAELKFGPVGQCQRSGNQSTACRCPTCTPGAAALIAGPMGWPARAHPWSCHGARWIIEPDGVLSRRARHLASYCSKLSRGQEWADERSVRLCRTMGLRPRVAFWSSPQSARLPPRFGLRSSASERVASPEGLVHRGRGIRMPRALRSCGR